MKENDESNQIDEEELALIKNIFAFTETLAIEIMIPRTDMICLYLQDTLESNLDVVTNSMHTRYPVCDPDKDHIVGYVHIKDLLKTRGEARPIKNLEEIMRPILSMPAVMPISKLLKRMQEERAHIVTIIDEYGGTSGVLTIEDIIEEIIGEIQDEFDMRRDSIEELSESIYNIDGQLSIEEFNDHFDTSIESEYQYTVGGWIYSQLTEAPGAGQEIDSQGIKFVVEKVEGLRIARILVHIGT